MTAAGQWLDIDPDPHTRATLSAMLEHAADGRSAELASCFAGPLTFGTAGLRAAMGPGPSRMNRVVVSRAAAGLGRYLTRTRGPVRVLVGHDARHNSARFARDSAEILAGAGHEVVLLDGPVPTPLVAFGLTGAAQPFTAGVVVTASHNPAADNGYKVYLDGYQIIPPVDAEISAEIAAVSTVPPAELPRKAVQPTVPDQLAQEYLTRAAQLVAGSESSLKWVHTALHGVGAAVLHPAVAAAGLPPAIQVAQQAEPDPDFPTVDFPNPEEPGALDLAIAQAALHRADLVIANDPDADRCAVAVPVGDPKDEDGWHILTGDELGALLGDQAVLAGTDGVFAASIVSGGLLERIARAAGHDFATTLTGFKWIARVPNLTFGYEEAIGYCCDPAAVADKDGITAALRVLQLAIDLKAVGSSLPERLDELAREHGLVTTGQVSIRVPDAGRIEHAMSQLRQHQPIAVGGEPVEFQDLADGAAARPGTGVELAATDAVVLTGESLRVVVRPSGTEPKLKIYLEVRSRDTADLVERRAVEHERMLALGDEMRAVLGI